MPTRSTTGRQTQKSRTSRGPGRGRARGQTTMKRGRRVAARSKAKKIQSAVGKTMTQTMTRVKRTALKAADVTGAVVTTAGKRVKREMAKRHLKQKMKRTGKALRAVAKTALVAGAAAAATRAAQEIVAVRRA